MIWSSIRLTDRQDARSRESGADSVLRQTPPPILALAVHEATASAVLLLSHAFSPSGLLLLQLTSRAADATSPPTFASACVTLCLLSHFFFPAASNDSIRP